MLSSIPMRTRYAFALCAVGIAATILRAALWPESWLLYWVANVLVVSAFMLALVAIRHEIRAARRARQRHDASARE